MSKNKSKSEKEGKKKEGKKEIADVVADAVGDLARKSTKKIIKSMEKRAENLVAKITPGNLIKTGAIEKTSKKKKERTKNTSDSNKAKPIDKKIDAKSPDKESTAK